MPYVVCCLGMIAAVAVPVSAGRAQTMDPDLEIVKDRLYDEFAAADFDAGAVASYIETLADDGSWPDIDYTDQGRSLWKSMTHIERMLAMARAYRAGGSPLRGDDNLKAHTISALDHWLKKDYKNPNWWYNVIGVPRDILQVLVLMEPALSDEQMRAGIEILKRAKIGRTGQNLVWVAYITIGRACLQGDADLAATAFERIAQEIRTSTDEGSIQPDLSFHQHGAQLYNGGYGYWFSLDCSRMALLAHGTRFALEPTAIDVLSRYILDAQRWMTRGATMDNSVHGRSIARRSHDRREMIAACENMAKLDTPRRDEFIEFARVMRGELDPGVGPTGNKHFWRSDFMVHRRKGYYTSVRMASSRVGRTEMINSTNLKGDHLSDGLTYIYRRGDEYAFIFPVWDWRRLPGTTCEQSDRPFTPNDPKFGVTTFAGGVSDGTYGCAAYDFKDGDLRARKSWFYFDREFVCLGAGITCPTDNPILTSINQCLMNGDVVVCDGDGVRAIEKGDRDIVGLRWAHHDGVGYVFPGGQAVHVKNEVQTGDWHDINTYEPPGEVSEDVFSLWLDHGAKPSGATYGYIVVPGIDADTMESYAANDIVVLSNAPQLQAARHRGLKIIGAAFYEPGVLNMDNGHTMAVDKPCLVLVREMGSEIELAVSNPDNEPLDLSVEISVQLTGDGCVWDPDKGATNIRVALPGGEMAGGSVIRKVRPAAG